MTIVDEDHFATASRDGTVKLWQRRGCVEQRRWTHHDGFVNALTYCAEQDCFVSGGSDSLIAVWRRGGDEAPLALLTGHTANVCQLRALPANSAPFTAASASWDGSARLWTAEWSAASNEPLQDPSVAGPCWAVAPAGPDTLVTGHADGSLRWWRGGRVVRVSAAAHRDVVRDLQPLQDGKYVASCGNDGAVRVWDSASGRPVATQIDAHPAFIYALAASQEGLLASAGEEGWVKVWRFTAEDAQLTCVAELRVPMLSVWSVAFSPDGTGLFAVGSGGSIVEFQQAQSQTQTQTQPQPQPQTQPQTQQQPTRSSAFQRRLAAFLLSLEAEQAGLERAAQSPDVLLRPGRTVGHSVIVRSSVDGRLEAHQWTGAEWQSLGEVVGRAAPSGKQRCVADGLDYDHVFTVQLDEAGGRAYELPYNCGDNPYAAAQAFLQRNDLPVSYLDQVAKFILDNAKCDQAADASEPGRVSQRRESDAVC